MNTPNQIETVQVTDAVMAAMADVEDTSTVFDSLGGTLKPVTVPGMPQYTYIPFGFDNQLPYRIQRLIGGDEVTSQNMFFNTLTCYGDGVEMQDAETGLPTQNIDVKEWTYSQNMPQYFLNQATDMKYFFFSVAVIILSKDGKRINRLLHKDACNIRLQQADKKGRIRNVFYADWSVGRVQQGNVERIPLLDLRDPLGDLRRKMGLAPLADGKIHQPVRDRKFAILLRFPTAGKQYYPVPYYSAIFRGGSYDEKRLISVGKRSKLRNQASVKYLVEINVNYWDRLCDDEGITDLTDRAKRIAQEKENIKNFVAGIENSGKVWISGFYEDADGHPISFVKITNIEGNSKEGGDWADDINIANNIICYGMNIHPNLVGAVPGKSQSNNSGSDKRELFTMKQALEKSYHDLLLRPIELAMLYNGWSNVRPAVPMIMLTTLDSHTDAVRINPAE